MTAFDVDPAAVDRLADELAGITAALVGASDVLGRTGAVAADAPGLVAALEAWGRAWRGGLSRLADEAAGTADAVLGAAGGYRRVEVAVAESCR